MITYMIKGRQDGVLKIYYLRRVTLKFKKRTITKSRKPTICPGVIISSANLHRTGTQNLFQQLKTIAS